MIAYAKHRNFITGLKGIASLGDSEVVNDHFDRIDLPTSANNAEDGYLRLSTGQPSSSHPMSCQRKTNKHVVKKFLYLKKDIASLGRFGGH